MFSICCNSCVNALRNCKNPERITKIKPCINKYNWEGINFPSEKDDWKKIEKDYLTIALNVLYAKKEKLYPNYVSKCNSNREKQVSLLMIPNREKWHYLAVKKLSSLVRRITSKHHVNFYCVNCLHSFTRVRKLESHKKVCGNKNFFNVIMPFEDTKILEFNQYQKLDKAAFMQILNV